MTVKELSKLYYLRRLIERDEAKLSELESRLIPGGITMSWTPRTPNSKSLIDELTPLIIKLRKKIRERQKKCIHDLTEIENYINSVDDCQVQLIMLYRFGDLLTWRQIALRVGGNNTADSVRKTMYRWMNRHGVN